MFLTIYYIHVDYVLRGKFGQKNGNSYQYSKTISYSEHIHTHTSSLHFIVSSHGADDMVYTATAVQQIRHHYYYYYVEPKEHETKYLRSFRG